MLIEIEENKRANGQNIRIKIHIITINNGYKKKTVLYLEEGLIKYSCMKNIKL